MPTAKKQTKTAFVLSLPHSLSAKDVVAKGKAAGIKLTDKHVWAIRSDHKRKQSKGTNRPTSKRGAHPKNVDGVSHTDRELLRTLAAKLGVSRVISILEAEREHARRILRS